MEYLVGGAATAFGLFGYNRGNYRFDIELGFERFLEGRNYVIDQVGQYREDIRGLTELTNGKCEVYQTLTTMVIAVGIPLYCAGRLSLHGPSPPNWLMGLIVTNLTGALCFCAVSSWLHLHAGGRCSAACTYLLTRKVRPPFPTQAQLDRARCFSSDYEKQKLGDILRIPFLFHGTGKAACGDHSIRQAEGSRKGRSSAERTNAQDSHENVAVPGWISSEFENSRGIGYVTAPVVSPLPEHFTLYAELQTEWWSFDVYGRVMMTFGLELYTSAFAYYYIGHIYVELTAMWGAFGCAAVMCIQHMLIWQMDVIPSPGSAGANLWPIDFALSWAPLVACIAMALEYKAEFDYNAVVASVVLIFLCYTTHFLSIFRWILMLIPDAQPKAGEPADAPGANWWPSSWKLPSSFVHCLYLLAPPRKLLPGQVDLLGEMKTYQPGVSQDSFQPGNATRVTLGSIKARCSRISEVFNQVNTYRATLPDDSLGRIQNLYTKFQKVASRVGASRGRDDDGMTDDDDDMSTASGVDDDTLQNLAAKLDEIEYDLNEIGQTEQMAIPLDQEQDTYTAGKIPFTKTVGLHPYTISVYACYPLLLCWAIMIGARVCDTVIGEQALVEKPLLEPWGRFPLRADGRNAPPIGGHTNKMYPWQMNTGTEAEWLAGEIQEHHRRLKELNSQRGPHSERPSLAHLEENHTGPLSAAVKTLNDAASDINTFKFFAEYTPPTKTQESESIHSVNTELSERIAALESQVAELPEKDVAEADFNLHVLQNQKVATVTSHASVEWPAVFEPRVLACAPGTSELVAALTPRGVATIFSITGEDTEVRRVSLSGLAGLGQIVGAVWNTEGLVVTTEKGSLGHCEGQPPSRGAWKCRAHSAPRLPIGSQGRLLSASVTRTKSDTLQAALVVEGEETVVMFELSEGSWLPIGEIPIPVGVLGQQQKAAVSMGASQLLMVTDDGVVHRQGLDDSATVSHPALTIEEVGLMPHEWHMACSLDSNRVARLAQRKTAEGIWRPTVFISQMA
jgi:hypothetical protein